jgi:hypothetical protein
VKPKVVAGRNGRKRIVASLALDIFASFFFFRQIIPEVSKYNERSKQQHKICKQLFIRMTLILLHSYVNANA